MLSTGTRIALSFLFGAAVGAGGAYYFTKRATEANCQAQIDEMHEDYEQLYAELKASYGDIQKEVDDVEIRAEEEDDDTTRVPVDFLDRVTDASGSFVDYAAVASQYSSETSEVKEQDISEEGLSESVESAEPTTKESTKKTKKKHRLPIRAITDEEYFDYCMKDDYVQKSYYLDDNYWTNTNSNKATDDINVEDFPIPLSEMKFDKKGVAYFVFEEKDTKILYKFWNRKDH